MWVRLPHLLLILGAATAIYCVRSFPPRIEGHLLSFVWHAAAAASNTNTEWTNGRFSGFITFGCDDIYIHEPNGGTWFAHFGPQPRQDFLTVASIDVSEEYPWATRYVVMEGELKVEPKRGFFGMHSGTFFVSRVISAKYPNMGESTHAVKVAERLQGIVLLTPHTSGFVPLKQKDEMWEMFPGRATWTDIRSPALERTSEGRPAVVEILGRVGPPGTYHPSNGAVREVSVDEIKFLRLVTEAEIANSAVFDGVRANLNQCIEPQDSRQR